MNLDRRTLLIGGGAGIGLVVAYALWPRHLGGDLATRPGEQAFGTYIKIARNGRITVAVPQAETGQGIWTALPQIVADELGAAWETVAVEPAPLTSAYANPLAGGEGWLDNFGRLRRTASRSGRSRITAGSTSVRAFEQPLREAAAVARAMLVGAAADRWNVDPGDCDTADGFVINGARTFTFGELAEEAAERFPPPDPPLRQTTQGPPDRPAAAAARRPGQGRGQPAFRRRRAASRHAVRIGPGGASGRALAVISTGIWRGGCPAFATSQRASTGLPSSPTAGGPPSARSRPRTRPSLDRADRRTSARCSKMRSPSGSRRRFRRGDYEATVEGSRPLTATYFVAPASISGSSR